ncbi:MAG: RhuM family protein [Candidatus Adiutrix sp.]
MGKQKEIIVLFKTEDEKVIVDVRFDKETAWLSLAQIAKLFERDNSTISRHIKNVFDDAELAKDTVVANFATTVSDGKTYQIDYDPRSPAARNFFATVQNKMHYAAHKHTAAEVVYERVDNQKPMVGMTNCKHRPQGLTGQKTPLFGGLHGLWYT